MGRGRNAEGTPEALAELLELARNRSVRLGLEPPRTRSVRISPVLVQNRFEQSRAIQHTYKNQHVSAVFVCVPK